MTTEQPEMTSHHWFRAVMAQRELDDLIGECVEYLDTRGHDSGPGSSDLNELLQSRMRLHPNGEDILALCEATGIYEAISEAADKWEAENARPLKVVRDS